MPEREEGEIYVLMAWGKKARCEDQGGTLRKGAAIRLGSFSTHREKRGGFVTAYLGYLGGAREAE